MYYSERLSATLLSNTQISSIQHNTIVTSQKFSKWTHYLVICPQQTTQILVYGRMLIQSKSSFAEKLFVSICKLCKLNK